MKPDVVAPGLAIFSARTRERPSRWDHIFFNDQPDGNMGDPNYNFFGDTPAADNTNWLYQSGTSMATPLTAGCAAVIAKVLRNKNLPVGAAAPAPSPPATLIKALIINNAQDLRQDGPVRRGRRGPPVGAAPDPAQGFGLVNLEAVLRNITDTGYGGMVRNGGPLVPPPGTNLFTQNFTITQNPLRQLMSIPATLTATLVWNDYPGAALINVLSLRATNNGQTRYGNTQHATNRDTLNNVQKVVWEGITPGATSLIVECHALGPGTLLRPNPSQNFSLVWYVSYGPPSKRAKAFATMMAVASAAVAIQYVTSLPG
jgi:hypothetical protein